MTRRKWEQSWARPAEEMPWYRSALEPFIAETATRNDLPPGVAIDVGCGAGTITTVLGEQFGTSIGLDFAFTALEQAKARARGSVAYFGVADALHLPIRDGCAALVVDRGCFHCLKSAGAARYLDEVARVLSPNGRFALVARTATAVPPLRDGLREPIVSAKRFARRVLQPHRGSLGHVLRSPSSLAAFMPDTLEVLHTERARPRSDIDWRLRHLYLVARRVDD